LNAACEIDQRRLILTAPSWAAVNTLKAELNHDGPSMALDKLLFDVKAERLILGPADIILFDEAGMTSTQQMLALMRIADTAGAKVILQGDTNQIAAVGRGDPLALIARATGSQRINTIRRQRVEWQRQASMDAQGGSIAKALASYAAHDAIVIGDNEQAVHEAMAVAFLKSGGEAVAVASTNQQVANLNYVLRQAAREMRLIGSEEITVRVIPRGQSKDRPKSVDLALAVGDRLTLGGEAVIDDVTLRNASRLEVMSIDLEKEKIILKTVDGQILVTSAAALAKAGKRGKAAVMQHAYAVTIHASQGATWSRTLWYTGHEDRM
jgi:ATP-dependent exoDNAse (exonuclease V) alpha subunit